MSNSRSQSKKVAILALFTAVTVVLQFISYFVKIGTFKLSLVLVPVVLSGILYGPAYSTYLGAVFGVITVIGCISGLDTGGNILFNASPLLTILVCMLKGTLCGAATGFVGKSLKSKNLFAASLTAAVTAPVVNTGIFLLLSFTFFKDILYTWAGGTNMVTYVIFSLTGVNFLIELGLNIILTPMIVRVIRALGKSNL